MNFKEIKELIGIVSQEPSIEELEVERSGVRVRIRKAGSAPPASVASVGTVPADATSLPTPSGPAAEAEDSNLVYVTSPMIGTFYRAPSPDADPFVSVGDSIEKGGAVCIIEAMKLMNEIDSEYDGEVVGVYVENGHPVQYGERLFAIKTG